jgi:hypothetical protein
VRKADAVGTRRNHGVEGVDDLDDAGDDGNLQFF